VAFLPLGTLAHALSNDAAAATLAACRAALRPGGLLVLELPHPEDVFNGQLLMGDAWDIEADGGRPALMVEFGSEEHDEFDAATQARGPPRPAAGLPRMRPAPLPERSVGGAAGCHGHARHRVAQLPCAEARSCPALQDPPSAERRASAGRPGGQRPASRQGRSVQVVQRRMTVSEVEPAEGGAEGDARVEPLGEGAVLQRVFTFQARARGRAPARALRAPAPRPSRGRGPPGRPSGGARRGRGGRALCLPRAGGGRAAATPGLRGRSFRLGTGPCSFQALAASQGGLATNAQVQQAQKKCY